MGRNSDEEKWEGMRNKNKDYVILRAYLETVGGTGEEKASDS